MQKKRAVVSISALNYCAQISVLATSLRESNPEIPFFHFVLDYDFDDNPLHLKKPEANCLHLKDLESFMATQETKLSVMNMLFKYDVVEACTAVKPFILKMMFANYHFDEIVFLDPDILICDRLDSVWGEFANSNILLTPHLIKLERPELALQSERSVLQSGTYNLGFLGLKRSDASAAFLDWWAERLISYCTREVHLGLFTDQKWVDIVAGAEPTVRILRNPGLNVAHWNIHERQVTKRMNAKYYCNEAPLIFFHFSGYEIRSPEFLTKHLTQLRVEDFGAVKELASEYRERLTAAGVDSYSVIPYGLNYFSNGIRIPEFLRQWARGAGALDGFKNVYDANERGSFFNSLFHSAPGQLCMFASIILNLREDLRSNFFGEHQTYGNTNFLNWIIHHGSKDYAIDSRIIRILRVKLHSAEGVPYA